jgi:hypothetical protein
VDERGGVSGNGVLSKKLPSPRSDAPPVGSQTD